MGVRKADPCAARHGAGYASGSVKNVLVERIDSIETTMAHIIPEFTSNLLMPIALLAYLFALDWRMVLAVLVTVPIGFGCYGLMTCGYAESYQNTVNKTKILNDTAVEYINGIEVIKAFGKAQSSYEKFVVAAKEGASCYVEVVQSGAHEQLMEQNGVYRRFVESRELAVGWKV